MLLGKAYVAEYESVKKFKNKSSEHMISINQIVVILAILLINFFKNNSLNIDTGNSAIESGEPVTSTIPTNSPKLPSIDSASPSAEILSQMTPAQVTSVVDGDTIKVSLGGETVTIRIIGIDTPETVNPRSPVQCYGREATNNMKLLVDGKTVYLEVDPSQDDRDRYKRLLRFVFMPDGTDVGLSMIADGFAHEYTYDKPYTYQQKYLAAQENARKKNRGLWSEVCNVTSQPTMP